MTTGARDADGEDKAKLELAPGLFTRAGALSAGSTAWSFRRSHRQLFHGVHVPRDDVVDDRRLNEAALSICPKGSYLSHFSAARLFGGVVPDDPDVHVTSPRNRPKARGIAGHRAKRNQQVTTWRGLRTTTPMQTFLDMAQVLTLVDLVVLGDSLVKRERFTTRQLVAFVAGSTGPHHRLAKRAAALVRKGVDSPMESRLRLLIVLAGLPEPKVNHRVVDADGQLIYRFDLCYLKFGLVIEYDGRQHADSTEQWHRDLDRDEQLDDWQIRRLVVVSSGIYNTPGTTLSRITKAMRQRGMTVPTLSDEWRRHFPSRAGDVASPS
ncbi:MAG TPA: hypothetical protein VIR15_07840 [Intrasporangium sp.]|uniref:hypothetical protein n=1 Tax=Intrasporangium sp. TaxID=1925024 RepID=UPI002F9348CC